MMNRSLVFAFGALAALATLSPAFADEPPPVKRAPARVAPRAAEPVRQAAAPANNWSGSQVGASNGGSFGNNAFADPGSYICPPGISFGLGCFETPFNFKGSPASYTVGPFLGYRIQAGSIVVGVEGDFSYKNLQTSQHLSATTSYPDFFRLETFTGSLKQTWDGSIRGRVGYLVTPWTLVYATGGLAFGQISGSLSYAGTIYDSATGLPVATAVANGSFSDTRLGVTAGGGVEYQLWGPWTARLEYRYTDFGKFYKTLPVINSSFDPTFISNPSPGASVQLHPSFQTVRLGLALNF
jgi:outer membrane immunogenic protein